MKIRSVEYLLIGALFGVLLLFGGCKGEPVCPDESEQYLLNIEEVRSKIPYLGNEQISYYDGLNQTLYFKGSGLRQSFQSTKQRDPNPDCNVYKTVYEEVLEFVYYDLSYSDSLYLQLARKNGTCTFIGNGSTFYFDVYAIKDRSTRFDSILINSRWYYNQTTLVNPEFDTLIINKDVGILQCVNNKTGRRLTISK